MGYLSCNAESAIATCDPHSWDLKKINTPRKTRTHKFNELLEIREFQHSELVAATNGFSADSFLGKGSHGSVYRASLDHGRLVAAVKRTKFSKPSAKNFRNHPASCTSPAENEVEILSRVRNPRLFVNLIGFCADSNGNKLIVVEYMPNGSLYDLLHSTSRPPGWTRRVRFALQVAKAVQALHSSSPPVIHRDIKSSNILIDEDWNARLGDFGLALRGHMEDVRVKCTPPAGTLGYLDPCYLAPGDLSTKSDVFSFGILLMEIISGRNAIDVNYSPPSVVDWAVPLTKQGKFVELCDQRIGTPSDPEVIRHLAVLAARCVRSTAGKRPSMLEVVEWLKLLRKRIQAPPIWKSLRRQMARVKIAQSLTRWEVYDRSEEVVPAVKPGSRRNGKVSNVTGIEYESKAANKVVRSKSIGSGKEIKLQFDATRNANMGGHPQELEFGRRKANVGVKMAVVKLNKSRSIGVLHCGSENGKGVVLEWAKGHNTSKNGPIHSAEIGMSELVTMDN